MCDYWSPTGNRIHYFLSTMLPMSGWKTRVDAPRRLPLSHLVDDRSGSGSAA